MLELYLPYLIALAIGMETPGHGQDVATIAAVPEATEEAVKPGTAAEEIGAATQAATEEVAEAVATATEGARTPEPQIATGQYTTALEVKPILGMTKLQWAAISHDGGNDLLYFSNLLAWRCGLWEIRYGINGAPATEVFEMEPCHEDTAQPNAMVDLVNYPIWVTLPGESIQILRIEVTFDDGTEDFVEVERSRILLP